MFTHKRRTSPYLDLRVMHTRILNYYKFKFETLKEMLAKMCVEIANACAT